MISLTITLFYLRTQGIIVEDPNAGFQRMKLS